MAKVTILSTQIVKPSPVEINGEGGFHLTAWDRRQYGTVYSNTVHLYRATAASMVDTLKESLSQTLAHFYPLAGRLRWAQGRDLEVDCNGKGVVLVEAKCDQDLTFFEADLAPEKMGMLVPVVNVKSTTLEELPLLYVQITRFRCGGAALGIPMCHVIVDGLSAFHFFSEWARLARGEPLKEAPYMNRKVLSLSANQGLGRHLTFSDHQELAPPPLLLGKQTCSDHQETKTLNLPLSEAQIQALKEAAAKLRAIDDADSRPYTRYEVVAAHMWRCACKARGHKEEQPTAIFMSFNMRTRTPNIPLPSKYFGNAVFKINAISKAGELISNPLGFACSKIREAISKVDEDYIWSNLKLLNEKTMKSSASDSPPYLGNPNLKVASWLTLPIFDMDFGWENPISMSPVVSDLDGASYVVPKPNDGRSIQVVLCLQVPHADEFKKYFYEDISIN